MKHWLFTKFADYLIARAMRTPYTHLRGYMNRYWLVPFTESGSASREGCGPVSIWRRPLAWLLQKCGVAVRVHQILRSDNDRHFHDHPWNYCSVILRGGYLESRPLFESGIYQGLDSEWYEPGAILFRRATDWHKLYIDGGKTCWTLFITTKYKQKWGFLMKPENKIPYDGYLKSKE